MRLKFKPFDGRSWGSIEVIDEETGRAIGHIQTKPGESIRISLFGGKYSANVSTYDECFGYVRGVGSVLHHMTLDE
jgi:hypothetical protein